MKTIITAAMSVLVLFGSVSLFRDGRDFHAGTPAYALCTTEGIKNDCCFKFFKVLEGGAASDSIASREKKAAAEFKRCLRADVGCSVEMTELKTKSLQQIRSICE